MTSIDHPDMHALDADPVDGIAAGITDVHQALNRLDQLIRDVACPGCDPSGERAAQVGVELATAFDLDFVDADMLLAHAADVRQVMNLVLLGPDCGHYDGEGEGDGFTHMAG